MIIVQNYLACEVTDCSSKRASGGTDGTSRCHSFKVIKKGNPPGGSPRLASPPVGVGRLLGNGKTLMTSFSMKLKLFTPLEDLKWKDK